MVMTITPEMIEAGRFALIDSGLLTDRTVSESATIEAILVAAFAVPTSVPFRHFSVKPVSRISGVGRHTVFEHIPGTLSREDDKPIADIWFKRYRWRNHPIKTKGKLTLRRDGRATDLSGFDYLGDVRLHLTDLISQLETADCPAST